MSLSHGARMWRKKWRRPSVRRGAVCLVGLSHTRMLRTSGGEWAAMARVAATDTGAANERRCSSADGRKWLATEVRPATRNLPPPRRRRSDDLPRYITFPLFACASRALARSLPRAAVIASSSLINLISRPAAH